MGSRDAEWDPAGSGSRRGSTFGRRLRTMNTKKNAKRALPLLFLTGLLTLAASAGARPARVHVGIRVGGPPPVALREVVVARPDRHFVWVPGHWDWAGPRRGYVWVR